MPREGRGLVAHALHQVPVARERPRAVVDELVADRVAQVALRDRHADRVREALAERTRRDLDAGGEPVLGVPRRDAAELAEPPQLVERQVVAAQVQQRVQEDRGVAARQHEAVAVRPGGSVGSWRSTREKSATPSGASAMAVPEWPLLAAKGASSASPRTTATARSSHVAAGSS